MRSSLPHSTIYGASALNNAFGFLSNIKSSGNNNKLHWFSLHFKFETL